MQAQWHGPKDGKWTINRDEKVVKSGWFTKTYKLEAVDSTSPDKFTRSGVVMNGKKAAEAMNQMIKWYKTEDTIPKQVHIAVISEDASVGFVKLESEDRAKHSAHVQ